DNHHTLEDAPSDERSLVSMAGDDVGNRRHSKCCAGAESGSRESSCQTTVIRKPLQGGAYRCSIHNTGAYSGHRIAQVKCGESISLSASNPAQSGENTSGNHQKPWTEFVHQPAFERHEPCL